MRKFLLSALSVSTLVSSLFFSLLYPSLSYAEVSAPPTQTSVPLWQVFCAHWVKAQLPQVDAQSAVFLENTEWESLVTDLEQRTLPVGFTTNESNLDLWLRCENEFAARFDTAEFLARGQDYFSVASVNSSTPVPASLNMTESASLYGERWDEFLKDLQKSVTMPRGGHTISMRAR